MVEVGTPRYFAKKYDIKFNRGMAKRLGNKRVGDGEKFKGRGFLQLTGRWNYEAAGKALGLPLVDHPELAERPDIAAKIAVWYWTKRVKPGVSDFTDVEQVTKKINSGGAGLQDRKLKFDQYR